MIMNELKIENRFSHFAAKVILENELEANSAKNLTVLQSITTLKFSIAV